MRWALPLLQIILIIAVGAVGALKITATHWGDWRQGLITALSLLCASVLIRLARGIPITDVDWYEDEAELEAFTAAYTYGMRQMLWVLGIALAAVLSLVFIDQLHAIAIKIQGLIPFSVYPERVVNALLASAIFYAFMRMAFVVRNDLSLANIQSKMLGHAFKAKKKSKAQQRRDEKDKALVRSGSDNATYGKHIEGHSTLQ